MMLRSTIIQEYYCFSFQHLTEFSTPSLKDLIELLEQINNLRKKLRGIYWLKLQSLRCGYWR